VSPPSRGRRKEGARAPSAKAGLRAGGVSVFPPDTFRAGGFPASVFAAIAVGRDDFGGFDGAFSGTRGCLFFAFLPDFPAGARLVFAAPLLLAVKDFAPADWPAAGLPDFLGDFLRDFLDIRLPFVAFSGSIIAVLQVLSRQAGIGAAR